MKKKTAVIFMGFFMALGALSGCGGNDATEAASESAQTEDEGTGEDEEMQEARKEEEEKKEKEEKKAEKEAEKASKEDKKETEKKSEAEDSENKKEAQEETETDSVKIAVLLPDQEEWSDDARVLEANLKEALLMCACSEEEPRQQVWQSMGLYAVKQTNVNRYLTIRKPSVSLLL